MKQILWSLALVFAHTTVPIAAQTPKAAASNDTLTKQSFQRSKDGIWSGKGTTCHKIDHNNQLLTSNDGKNWTQTHEGHWEDLDGKWIRIHEQKIWWSTDRGMTWAELPEGTWQAPDKKSYRLDAAWQLWVKP